MGQVSPAAVVAPRTDLFCAPKYAALCSRAEQYGCTGEFIQKSMFNMTYTNNYIFDLITALIVVC